MKNTWNKPSQASIALNEVGALVSKLPSQSAVERLEARRGLVACGSSAVPALLRALFDRRDGVRWEAAKALLEIGDGRSISPLVRALKDKDPNVRWVAAEGLIAMREHSLVALFKALLKDRESEPLRDGVHHVCHALAKGNPPSVAAQVVLRALGAHESEIYLPLALDWGLELLRQRNGVNRLQ